MRWPAVGLVAVCLVFGVGCELWGKRIDDFCVAGKLTTQGASLFNNDPDSANLNRHGDYPYAIKEGDRIVNGQCSELLKELTQ